MEAKLVVVSGKANMGEVKLRLPMTIGRGRKADLIISHPTISRIHCELYEVDGALVVRDNGSSNGTYLDDEQIKEAVVRPGQTLKIGPLSFRAEYKWAGAAPNLKSGDGMAATQTMSTNEMFSHEDDDAPAPAVAKSKGKPEQGKSKKPTIAPPEEEAPAFEPAAREFTFDPEVDFSELDRDEAAAPMLDEPTGEPLDDLFGSDFPKLDGGAATIDETAPSADPEATFNYSPPDAEDPLAGGGDFDFLADLDKQEAEAQAPTPPAAPPAPVAKAPPAAKAPKPAAPPKDEPTAPTVQLPAKEPESEPEFDDAAAFDFLSDFDPAAAESVAKPPVADEPAPEPVAEMPTIDEAPAVADEPVFDLPLDELPIDEPEPEVAAAPEAEAAPEFVVEPEVTTAAEPSFDFLAEPEVEPEPTPTPAEPVAETPAVETTMMWDASADEAPAVEKPAFDLSFDEPQQHEAAAAPEAEAAPEFVVEPEVTAAAEPSFDFLAEPEAEPTPAEPVAETPAVETTMMWDAPADEAPAVEKPSVDEPVAAVPSDVEADFDFLAAFSETTEESVEVAEAELPVEDSPAPEPIAWAPTETPAETLADAPPAAESAEPPVPTVDEVAQPAADDEALFNDFLAEAATPAEPELPPAVEPAAAAAAEESPWNFEIDAEPQAKAPAPVADWPALDDAPAAAELPAAAEAPAVDEPFAPPAADEVAAPSGEADFDAFDFLEDVAPAPSAEAPQPEPVAESPIAESSADDEAFSFTPSPPVDEAEPTIDYRPGDDAEAAAPPAFAFEPFVDETPTAAEPAAESEPMFSGLSASADESAPAADDAPAVTPIAAKSSPAAAAKPAAAKLSFVDKLKMLFGGSAKKPKAAKAKAKPSAAAPAEADERPIGADPFVAKFAPSKIDDAPIPLDDSPLPDDFGGIQTQDGQMPYQIGAAPSDEAPIPFDDEPAATAESPVNVDDAGAVSAVEMEAAFAEFTMEAPAEPAAVETSDEVKQPAGDDVESFFDDFLSDAPATEAEPAPTAAAPVEDFWASNETPVEAEAAAPSPESESAAAAESADEFDDLFSVEAEAARATFGSDEAAAEADGDPFGSLDADAAPTPAESESPAADEPTMPFTAAEAPEPVAPSPSPSRRRPIVDVDTRLMSSHRSTARVAVRTPRIEVPQLEPDPPAGRTFNRSSRPASAGSNGGAQGGSNGGPKPETNVAAAGPEASSPEPAESPAPEKRDEQDLDDFLNDLGMG